LILRHWCAKILQESHHRSIPMNNCGSPPQKLRPAWRT
jgi:hypothetical protein